MTNSAINNTVTNVNAEGQAVQVVQVATNAEQMVAAGIGLITAGPLGAIASWGALRTFAGKWTPWGLTGLVAAPVLAAVQLAVIGAVFTGSESFQEGLKEGSANVPIESTTLASKAPTFGTESFGQIREGMSLSEVEALIGKGKKGTTFNSSYGTMTTYSWGHVFDLYGSVTIRNGRVTSTVIMDNR